MSQKKGDIDIGWRAYEEVFRIFPNRRTAAKALGCSRKLFYAWRDGVSPSCYYLAMLHFFGGDVMYVLTGRRSK